jgi:simple sugar transport system permease protein
VPLLVLGAALTLVVGLLVAGVNPVEALTGLLKGAFGSPASISGTLQQTTPLLIGGLAVFLALRAGLFNIGVEGQLMVGALACVVVALRVPGTPGVLLGSVVGMVAGALWALPAGLIKAYRNGHEVITTIMLNNVAGFLTAALIAGPFKDPSLGSPSTATLPAGTRLPALVNQPPFLLNLALPLGLVLTALLALWLSRTVAGFELRAAGANPIAARLAGIPTARVTVLAMLGSGALAGLAGAVQALAYQFRYYEGFSPGYGFDALGVALLAGNSAYGVIPAALLFGALSKGGTAISVMGVPKGLTTVILGLLILVAAAVRYRKGSAVD